MHLPHLLLDALVPCFHPSHKIFTCCLIAWRVGCAPSGELAGELPPLHVDHRYTDPDDEDQDECDGEQSWCDVAGQDLANFLTEQQSGNT